MYVGSCCARSRRGTANARLWGEPGQARSSNQPDVGLGTRQGEVDSSDAFAAFIDDLDAEIERRKEKLGWKLDRWLMLVT